MLAAVRETFEETGLLLGSRQTKRQRRRTARGRISRRRNPARPLRHAFRRPRRHPAAAKRRYDTRFFTADVSTIAHRIDGKVGADSELVELEWLPLSHHQAAVELIAITEIVLRELAGNHKGFSHELPMSYSQCSHGQRVRACCKPTGRFP